LWTVFFEPVGVWMLATVFEDFWAHFCWSIRQQLDCMSFWPFIVSDQVLRRK
jgi:hypothetical protein